MRFMAKVNKTIFSKVFIREDSTEGRDQPLKLTWREATLQDNGTYRIRAFNQLVGQKAEDITEQALKDHETISDSEDDVNTSFEQFKIAFECGYDIYDANPAPYLTENQIERHRVSRPNTNEEQRGVNLRTPVLV